MVKLFKEIFSELIALHRNIGDFLVSLYQTNSCGIIDENLSN